MVANRGSRSREGFYFKTGNLKTCWRIRSSGHRSQGVPGAREVPARTFRQMDRSDGLEGSSQQPCDMRGWGDIRTRHGAIPGQAVDSSSAAERWRSQALGSD